MFKKMSDKQLASVIIIIVMLLFVLLYCLMDRTGAIHFYPVLKSSTSDAELCQRQCIVKNGTLYYYSDSLFKRGIYKTSDNENRFLFNTGKVYSITAYENIIAFMTKDNIFFYDCDSDLISQLSETELSKTKETVNYAIDFYNDDDYLYANEQGIYLVNWNTSICVYPFLKFDNQIHEDKLTVGQDNNQLNLYNPNFPNESVSISVDTKNLYDGIIKPYGNKSVCFIYNCFKGGTPPIGRADSRVIIADFDKKSAEYVFTAGDKQQVVYANDKKCVYYDFKEKGFFSYDYASGESELLQKCRLLNFLTYYIESADDNTLVVYNRFLKLKSIIRID